MKKAFIVSIFLSLLVSVIFLLSQMEVNDGASIDTKEPISALPVIAYVACSDKKIYELDLSSGSIVRISDAFPGLGSPSDIDFGDSTLYIGSARGRGQNDYYPLIMVDTKDGFFNIKKAVRFDPDIGALDQHGLNKNVRAVYSIVLSADGDNLFVGIVGQDKFPSVLLNSTSGEVIRKLTFTLTKNNTLSPDGLLAAEIYPSGEREVVLDGKKSMKRWNGGVAIRNLESGDWVSKLELENNQGLQPPWDLASPLFLYFRGQKQELEVYDRASGMMITSIDLHKLTGLHLTHTHAVLLPDANIAAFSMIDSDQQGYIVLIDVEKEVIISKVMVGLNPTNIALAKRL